MTNRRDLTLLAAGFTAALGMVATYQLGRARADGIPTTPTLYYGVTLEENGTPLAGPQRVRVRLFNQATGGTPECESDDVDTAFVAGRARIGLPSACVTVIRAAPDHWVEITRGGTPVGGRVKLGAVPYAVEAQRANALTDAGVQQVQNAADLECPRGYARDASATPGIVCSRDVRLGATMVRDEVVQVGTGATAFWIDRYEAGAFRRTDGAQLSAVNEMAASTGPSVDATGLEINGWFPAGPAPALALSRPGFPTTRVSWFQASALCNASGKRLVGRREWFEAAKGAVDGSNCHSAMNNAGPRAASAANSCVSHYGVHDMIGNVSEWTDEWFAGAGGATDYLNVYVRPWPAQTSGSASFADDETVNLPGCAFNGQRCAPGMPGAMIRGGSWNGGAGSGIFAMSTYSSPAVQSSFGGFRCVIPRP